MMDGRGNLSEALQGDNAVSSPKPDGTGPLPPADGEAVRQEFRCTENSSKRLARFPLKTEPPRKIPSC